MYDFICMGPPSCEEREASQKKIKMKIYVFTGNRIIQQPFAFKASALDHWATLTVDKLWFKLFHGMCIKLTRVTKHTSN